MMKSHSENRSHIERKQINTIEVEMVKPNNEREAGKKRGFLRLPQVLEILPVSKSTWWKGIRDGRFPKPVKLSERTSAWSRADIDALCDQFVLKAISGMEKPLS
jgi:prophage regulatory protein